MVKEGQSCTYVQEEGREFSAKITRVIENKVFDEETKEANGKKETLVDVEFQKSGRSCKAELVCTRSN